MEYVGLFFQTILFRPYVFIFLAAFLFSAIQLIGWDRTWRFWVITWGTAFVCEFSSTRIGIPFGWYHYNGSTVGQELYFFNIPFMDSISFSFLLYAAYCVALGLLLPLPSHSMPPRPSLLTLRLDLSTFGLGINLNTQCRQRPRHYALPCSLRQQARFDR